MPQRDRYHMAVRRALEKAGWLIVRDPLWLKLDHTKIFIDLEAVKIDSVSNSDTSIAIEVKVLQRISVLEEIEKALGQYILYRALLELKRPTYGCYLAVPEQAYQQHLEGPDFQYVLNSNSIRILTFDPEREEVVRWIN